MPSGNEARPPPAAAERAPARGARPARRVRASELLGPGGRVLIEHAGETYELRVTRNDKLILTK